VLTPSQPETPPEPVADSDDLPTLDA
jgi:hypothetical protein